MVNCILNNDVHYIDKFVTGDESYNITCTCMSKNK